MRWVPYIPTDQAHLGATRLEPEGAPEPEGPEGPLASLLHIGPVLDPGPGTMDPMRCMPNMPKNQAHLGATRLGPEGAPEPEGPLVPMLHIGPVLDLGPGTRCAVCPTCPRTQRT